MVYQPTGSKYKGSAKEFYVTYDLPHEVRDEGIRHYPKVQRVYIPGAVVDTDIGRHEKRSGMKVFGVKITYEKPREGFQVRYGETMYDVEETDTTVSKIVELPDQAKNVEFRDALPGKYEEALQSVR